MELKTDSGRIETQGIVRLIYKAGGAYSNANGEYLTAYSLAYSFVYKAICSKVRTVSIKIRTASFIYKAKESETHQEG